LTRLASALYLSSCLLLAAPASTSALTCPTACIIRTAAGGCEWIDAPYPEQLKRKHKIVADALGAYASLKNVEVPNVAASPMRLGYRARVKLVARTVRGEIRAGCTGRESHEVVDISSCPVHPQAVNRVVQYLKREVDRLGIAPYDERSDAGDLRYIDIRFSFFSREMVLTLVTRRANFPAARSSRARLCAASASSPVWRRT
jgi:tRNA/tmRNA/rRNA uracil-C5-methylase (TrmA/RlmC/RlmD family)